MLVYELKWQIKSLAFYLVAVAMAIFIFTQSEVLWFEYPSPPMPGLTWDEKSYPPYGTKKMEDTRMSMVSGFLELLKAYQSGTYEKETFWGLRSNRINLTNEQRQWVKSIMNKIGTEGDTPDGEDPTKYITILCDYNQFQKMMDTLNAQLGGNTGFASQRFTASIITDATYEDAVAEYQQKIEYGMTRVLAVQICDISGLAVGILPIFLAAFAFSREKKRGIQETIGSKSFSSIAYVWAKFTGICLPVLFTLMVIFTVPTIIAAVWSQHNQGIQIFAYYATMAVWLFPTVLITAAMGLFVSTVTGNGAVAVLVQAVLWFISSLPFEHSFGLYKIFLRYDAQAPFPSEWVGDALLNRIFITVLALGLVMATGVIYNRKRERMDGHVAV